MKRNAKISARVSLSCVLLYSVILASLAPSARTHDENEGDSEPGMGR